MNWNLFDRIVNVVCLFALIAFGTFALYVHNNLLPYIYLIFSIGAIIAHTYLYCTRCKYYGENCYIFGGKLSKYLFKKRNEEAAEPDDSVCIVLWLLVALFPIPFLLYYIDWYLFFIYVFIVTISYILHSQTACFKCENKWCSLNKNK